MVCIINDQRANVHLEEISSDEYDFTKEVFGEFLEIGIQIDSSVNYKKTVWAVFLLNKILLVN